MVEHKSWTRQLIRVQAIFIAMGTFTTLDAYSGLGTKDADLEVEPEYATLAMNSYKCAPSCHRPNMEPRG